MGMKISGTVFGVMMAMTAISSPAMAELQPISVSNNATWKHKESKVALPPILDGLTRSEIEQNGSQNLDILIQYQDPTGDLITTFFLYRPAINDESLWFDRAAGMLKSRAVFADANASSPVAFALSGRKLADAMRISFTISKGPYKSTGLAIVPIGPWLLKLRMTSKSLDAATLDTRMVTLLSALDLPHGDQNEAAIYSILPCNAPLTLTPAKQLAPDYNQAMANALLALPLENEVLTGQKPHYCRDSKETDIMAIYRADQSTTSYLLVMGDSGRAISAAVAPVPLEPKIPPRYGVTLFNLDARLQFYDFDALPTQDQAIDMVENTEPLFTVSVDSRNKRKLELNSDYFKK